LAALSGVEIPRSPSVDTFLSVESSDFISGASECCGILWKNHHHWMSPRPVGQVGGIVLSDSDRSRRVRERTSILRLLIDVVAEILNIYTF
jgi:hypothetical protein